MDRASADGFVAGEWRPFSGATIRSLNPATEQPIVEVTGATAAEVGEAVEAARAARSHWGSTAPEQRSSALHAAADRLQDSLDDIAEAIAAEVGKPIREAREEAARSVTIVRYHANGALDSAGRVVPHAVGTDFMFTQRQPLGTVGLITPWNFPLAIPLWKLAPALAYGNTVVMKPAPHATGLALRIAELFADLPAGVFNLVPGDRETGEALAASRVNGISLTGANATGRAVAAQVAVTGARYQAELGGKNASVVLESADLQAAAETIASAAMGFAGQKCTATSRVIVERSIAPTFQRLLVERIDNLRVGIPSDPTTDVGPLIDAASVQRVQGFVDRAIADGGELLTGGKALPGLGACYYAPTVIALGSSEVELARTEVFGPVLAYLVANDAADALEIANSTEYGLAAAVFTQDLRHGLQFAQNLQAGLIRVNGATPGVPFNAPFGPAKSSGIGLPEQGKEAQIFFTQERTVTLA